ncbi:MAG: methyltransferase domain-containing protein [Proteobacteria bacterium]|nr:methyltransferase domain-containing protein [Pseudomonadota bacterium]
MKENFEKPYYGYRINTYITCALMGSGIVGIALAIIFTILRHSTWVLILCWALGAILLIWGVFWRLSVGFVNDPKKIEFFQDNFADQLRTVWDGKGKVLDIGTGLGRVAIEIARRFPEAQVVGVDTWTKKWGLWGMTKTGTEKNARIVNVSDRCTFRNGNVLDLPFEEGEFQLVVSAFVFHEIHVPDRAILLKEVVRVLAPGGRFLICDLFQGSFLKKYQVKNVPELLQKIEQLGVDDVRHNTLKEAGVDLGGLYHIWGIAYLSGRKV